MKVFRAYLVWAPSSEDGWSQWIGDLYQSRESASEQLDKKIYVLKSRTNGKMIMNNCGVEEITVKP